MNAQAEDAEFLRTDADVLRAIASGDAYLRQAAAMARELATLFDETASGAHPLDELDERVRPKAERLHQIAFFLASHASFLVAHHHSA